MPRLLLGLLLLALANCAAPARLPMPTTNNRHDYPHDVRVRHEEPRPSRIR